MIDMECSNKDYYVFIKSDGSKKALEVYPKYVDYKLSLYIFDYSDLQYINATTKKRVICDLNYEIRDYGVRVDVDIAKKDPRWLK